MRYVLDWVRYEVFIPQNIEFYLQVNPVCCMEVRKCRGGWKLVEKGRWLGNLPIKAKLITASK